ncbi:helix-turn-helix domain-containing protein (plasmid) [Weissella paramesenteroides]
MTLEKLIGNRIRCLRLQKNLSQEKFAELIGVHRTYIGMVERGERNITIQTLLKIAKGLDVHVWQLLKDIDV